MSDPDYTTLYNIIHLLGCWYVLLDLIKVFWENQVEQIRIIRSTQHLITMTFVDGSNKERCTFPGALLAVFWGTYMFLLYQNLSITSASFKASCYTPFSAQIYGICKQLPLTVTADKIVVIYHCLCISSSHFALMLFVLFISKASCLILSIELQRV